MNSWIDTVRFWEEKGFRYEPVYKTLILHSSCKDQLDKLNIENEQKHGHVHVKLHRLPFSYFANVVEFRSELRESHLKKDVLIHDFHGAPVVFPGTGEIEPESGHVAPFLIENAKVYFETIEFLKTQSEHIPGEFEFVDQFSGDHKRVVFSSVTEKKRVILPLKIPGIPELAINISYRVGLEEMKSCFEPGNRMMPAFLKSALVSNLYSRQNENAFVRFLEDLPSIVREARLNHSVYLHDLSLKKIQSEYREYKRKYFSDQNEILSRISNQVLALPVSIAGSAFALNKLDGSIWGMALVMMGLTAFASYASYIASILWKDTLRIGKLIESDFNQLIENEFFSENPKELRDFENTKNWMVDRVVSLKTGLIGFYYIVWCSTVGLVSYGVSLIWEPPMVASVTGILLCLGIVTGVSNYVILPQDLVSVND